MFSVWFPCNTCRASFKKLDDFLEHKIKHHFEEFQNTKYIIFEERRIKSEGSTDLEKIKIENEFKGHLSDPEFPCDTVQSVGFIKSENQSTSTDQQDCVDHFIPSKNVTATNSNFDPKPAVDTVYNSQEPTVLNTINYTYEKCLSLKPDPDLENGNNAEANLIASELSSDFGPQILTGTQENPFVLIRRLTSKEIQNYSAFQSDSSSSFQCKLCLHKFKSDMELKIHVVNTCGLSHQHRRRFCAPCNRKFDNRRRLLRHNSRHHAPKQKKIAKSKSKKSNKQCLHCSKKFQFESERKRHAVKHVHKNERPYKCLVRNCCKTFKSKWCAQQHNIRVHRLERKFKCLHINCEKKFKLQCDLRNHLFSHSDQPRVKCPTPSCPITFKTKDSIRLHMKRHLNLQPFKCPKAGCKKAFNFKTDVESHLASHSDARPFKCPNPNCTKDYKHKRDVRRHVKLAHSCPFKCPENNCGKSFKDDNSLQQHQILHHSSDPRPFKCTQVDCGKSFKTINILKRHAPIHFDPRPFKCQQIGCGKSFKTHTSLWQHRTIHLEVKPFQCLCKNCGKRFRQGEKLNRHLHDVPHSDSS